METKELKQLIIAKSIAAKLASRKLAGFTSDQKNKILLALADAIAKQKDEILFRNEIDVEAAKESGLNDALIDRLALNEKRISEMTRGLKDVAVLPDPVGEIIADWTPPLGIHIQKIKVPLGVIAMIYESRPNVTVDATGLCLKAGNAVILRGGSEAINTNHTLFKIIAQAAGTAGLPEGAIGFIETTDREAIFELVKLDNLIDLVIPRGGEQMIRDIRQQATVPVLSHGKGLCHTYIDKDANLEMAKKIAVNAKCQRPGVCNALETLLMHKDIAKSFLPPLCNTYKEQGVEVRGCQITKSIVPEVIPAKEEDWSTEYLDLVLSIKVVDSAEEAINHINKYGSGHSEAIITENKQTADKFLKEVDAAAVFHNASTRLHDGSVFGLGSEIGISTQKLHARGTMGIKELTTTKYIVHGNGEIRE
ncbi:MAG: glutamate-5-semialdehyde dehydrogenase [Elusimicrobia bacterium]|nr:glutamate-5-semialdehyde dehydrogenase [Candidatus Liberimonas magnetica]